MESRIKNFIALAVLMGSSFSVSALPTLQTYIDGSTYDATTQTWVTNASSFTISALGTNEGKGQGTGSVPLANGTEVFFSIAIDKLPTDGSITVDGTTIASSSFVYGVPPEGLDPTPPNSDELPSHSIFDTWFTEYSFTFDASNACLACVSDMAPDGNGTDKDGWIEDFVIDITGFNSVHFDLYTKKYDTDGHASVDHFAPFSHDAEYNVPTPGILYLFGIGLIGMCAANRHKA